MLCHLCDTLLANIIHQDFTTWRRIKEVEEKWFTFKIGNHATVTAAASSGCELCALFNQVRDESIPNYKTLGEKWHHQAASIDVKPDEDSSKWTFQLLTIAPEMSWIAFEIFMPGDAHENNSDLADGDGMSQWPLEVSAVPASSKSLGIARSWIEGCLESHPECMRFEATPLPTRVIDVGPSGQPSSPKLFISRGEVGQYLVLSHTWGTGHRVTLTKNNLAKFEKGIVFEKLPKTFQDAIELTRFLGFKYLWIDALCICQGDEDDWKKESTSMCLVFENAVLSISAVSATDSHSGMLQHRRLKQTRSEVCGMNVGIRQKLDSLREAMARSRLETRAWCYQERLLPISILHIGPSQMYWECNTHIASEAFPGSLASTDVTCDICKPDTRVTGSVNFSNQWLQLVSIYSGRHVTRPSDRLPAIAGLADKAKQARPGSKYLHGLWSDDLYGGLLWKRQLIAHGKLIPSRDKYFARLSITSGERSRTPIAPSWSWASTNDAVEYPHTELCPERSPAASDARFLLPGATEDDTYTLPEMLLPVNALMKRGICKISSSSSGLPDQASFKPSGSLLTDEGLRCYLDYVDDPVSKTCYCVRIASWKQMSSNPKRKGDDGLEQASYLILERVQHESSSDASEKDDFGVFRRIGMGHDFVRKADRIFANAERRALRLM